MQMSSGSLSGVRSIDVERDLDARRVGAVTTQQPPMGTLLAKYLKRLLSDAGESGGARSFAYRGQRNAEWPLQSSAYRRLSGSETGASSGNAVSVDRLIEYNENLISDFRNRRFDVSDGTRLTDLGALSLLQHLGAATSLIDFSLSPLVALWFACQDAPHGPDGPTKNKPDGAVFRVDTTFSRGSDPEWGFEEIVRHLESTASLLAWRPPTIAGAGERIIAQQSVLLLGGRLMVPDPDDPEIRRIEVLHSEKDQLRRDLEAIGVDETLLFPDAHGFARINGVEYEVPEPTAKSLWDRSARPHSRSVPASERARLDRSSTEQLNVLTRLRLANLMVDSGKYGGALSTLNEVEERVSLLPAEERHRLYLNRANVKAAMGDHEGAVTDYTHALGLGSDPAPTRFNRGNSFFILEKFQDALEDFEACAGRVDAAHNAGNTYIALGKLGLAARKFLDARNETTDRRHSHINLEAVNEIMSLIGADQCEVEVQSTPVPNAPSLLRFVIRSDRLKDGSRLFPIAGNAGSQGNVGWGDVGGQGFSGSDGMTVEVTSSTVGKT